MRGSRQWRWDLNEVFINFIGDPHYLWRAVDQKGELLESFGAKSCDKKAVLACLRRALKRHGSWAEITTDGPCFSKEAMTELGIASKEKVNRWANNVVENGYLLFRRRSRAMLRFRQMTSLQKFASVHPNVHFRFASRLFGLS